MLILSLPFSLAETPQDVKLDAYVKDYVGVLNQQDISNISAMLAQIKSTGKAEVAVVIINSLEGQDKESFALQVAQGNLGNEKVNNGLLLLVSIQDRVYRFEVGRGLEPYFNDAKIGRIGRDYLVPAFKAGDYATGIKNSIQAIGAELGTADMVAPQTNSSSSMSSLIFMFLTVLFSLFPFIIIIVMITLFAKKASYVNKNNTGKKGKDGKRKDNDYLMAGLIAASLLGRGGRGGFGGGGFSGGGFGGFGGGGFGGGGAGGSF